MKKIFFSFSSSCFIGLCAGFVLTVIFSCESNKEKSDYQMHGKITDGKGLTFLLIDMNSSQMEIVDSAKADENGEFYFLRKVSEKGFYSIKLNQTNFFTVITDSTEKLNFEADADNLSKTCKVSGSKDSEIFIEFNKQSEKIFENANVLKQKQDSIRRVFEAFLNTTKDSLSIDSLSKTLETIFNKNSEELQKISDKYGVFLKKFIDENLGSYVTLAAVQMMALDENIFYYEKVVSTLIKKYPTAIPRLYVTPCPKDCIHDGKTSCPVKLANDASRKKIDNIQNLKQN